MATALTLNALPSDVLIIVVLFADLKSALVLSATCRMFYGLVKDSAAIQLYLELAAQGLLLNPTLRPTRSFGEWYNRLIQVRNGWLNLKTSGLSPLKLTAEDNEMLSEVRGGMFTCGARTPGASDGINRVKVVKLTPSSLDHTSKPQTYPASTVSTGRYLSAFRSSAEQDLIALGTVTRNGPCLTIHTLSGASHPLAKSDTLELRTDRFMGFAAEDPQPVQIQGDLISALLCSGRPGAVPLEWEVVIWNWKTGTLVFRKAMVAHTIAFTFLSSTSYLLAEQNGDAAHLLVGDLYAGPDISMPPAPRCKLLLPELSPSWRYGPLHFRNDLPSPVGDTCRSSQVFLPDPEAGVICLSVVLSEIVPSRRANLPHLGLFIGRDMLRRDVLSLKAVEGELLEFDWAQWGERVTRWIDMGEMPGLLTGVHGSRFIQLIREERSSTAWLQVLDFNPSSVYRYPTTASNHTKNTRHSEPMRIGEAATSYKRLSIALSEAYTQTSTNSVLVEAFGSAQPTVLDISGAFLHKVVSRLPYRCVTRVAPFHASSEWTIDGEYLLRVDEPEGENDFCIVHPYIICDRSEEV